MSADRAARFDVWHSRWPSRLLVTLIALPFMALAWLAGAVSCEVVDCFRSGWKGMRWWS